MTKTACYNYPVARIPAKKTETVLINMDPETFTVLSKIADAEDRPRGYVARELMIRGFGLYAADGNLKDAASLTEIFDHSLKQAAPQGVKVAKHELTIGRERQKAPVVARITPADTPKPSKADVRRMLEEEAERSRPAKRRRSG